MPATDSPDLSPAVEVVILNDFASFNGGASVVALRSVQRLAELGHRVTLFSAVGPVDPGLAELPGVRVVCLGQEEIAKDGNRLRAFTRGAWNRPAAKALDAVLAALDPATTVVHAHLWMKALSPAVFTPAFARGFPVAVTLHDFFVACPNGGFYEYPTDKVCRRDPLSVSCLRCSCDRRSYAQKLWRSGRTFLQNRVARVPARVGHYIGVSEFSLDILRPFLPAGAAATVVRNPIDCQDLGPAPVAGNDRFVFAGRLVPEKGPRLFAEAARRAGVRAVFVGDGELRGELARDFPEVEITGWQTPAQVTAHLRQARALVFPSLWYETLGLVVVEAAANGVPAVVSDGCAARETVLEGGRGRHFPAGSVEGLAERLRALDNSPEGRAQAETFGRAAYDWYWKDPWTSAKHVDDLRRVYARMLVRPGTPRLSAPVASELLLPNDTDAACIP